MTIETHATTENPPPPGEQLCQSVSLSNLAEVQRLLAAGVDPNERSARYHRCALMLANRVEMVDLRSKPDQMSIWPMTAAAMPSPMPWIGGTRR